MSINKIRSFRPFFSRSIHTSRPTFGADSREKRSGHVELKDTVDGEQGSFNSSKDSYSLIDENLLDTVIDNVKFKDIPILHLICTRNNTKMALTSGNGKRLVLKTCGTEGYKNCRKGTTVAAQAVAKRVLGFAEDHEINMARLVFNGLGPGRNAAYKVIELSKLKIVSLSDRTEAIEPWIQRPRAAKSI